jgi:hypothetical protein
MPINFLIDVEHRVVFTVAIDVFSIADAIDHMNRLRADARYSPFFNQLADFRDVTDVQLSGLDVRTFAKEAIFSTGSRRALVIATPVAYGLARMFATLRELAGEAHISIVRTMPEAADWVRVDLPLAEQACAALKQGLRDGRSPSTERP